MIYGTVCGGPWCAPGAGSRAAPRGARGTPPSRGPRQAPLVPGVTGAVPTGAAGTVGSASSSHGLVGAGAKILLWQGK